MTVSAISAPAAIDSGALGDHVNSVLVPEHSAMLVTSSDAAPVLVTFNGLETDPPVATVPKSRDAGSTSMPGCGFGGADRGSRHR